MENQLWPSPTPAAPAVAPAVGLPSESFGAAWPTIEGRTSVPPTGNVATAAASTSALPADATSIGMELAEWLPVDPTAFGVLPVLPRSRSTAPKLSAAIAEDAAVVVVDWAAAAAPDALDLVFAADAVALDDGAAHAEKEAPVVTGTSGAAAESVGWVEGSADDGSGRRMLFW